MPQNQSVSKTLKTVEELLSNNMPALASNALEKGIQANPNSKELQFLQARVASESRDFYAAASLFDSLLENEPDNPKLLLECATAWSRLGEIDKSIKYSKRAMELSANSVISVLTIADIYERNNHVDEAEVVLNEITENLQENGNYQRLKVRILIAKKEYSDAIDCIQNLLNAGQDNTKKTKLYFLLCKAYDRLGEYDKAWAAASEAHACDHSPFDERTFFSQFDEMRSLMTKELLDVLVEGPPTEFEPLFIVGNPRSGTSLLEQILGMHTEVQNGGEMSSGTLIQADVASLTDSFHPWPTNIIDLKEADAIKLSKRYCGHCNFFRNDASIVSNKALNLHLQLGFLSKILPSSRAILLQRHPLDNAVSCFTTNLLAAGLPYTNSLEAIGKTWIKRKQISALWLDILSIPVLELQYESLVANQREETERILKFLNLPWQEDCMEFHTSKQVARTISFDQVNQKIYNTSCGRWKNYEKHLGSLTEMFTDYM
ncbi:MAG: sulfotransferase [Phycisphaerales bacterium]|nr:sulfotransferase [Phycisphaerales bacterium]